MTTAVLMAPSALARARRDVVVLDASWIYAPFNAAGIDVRQRWAAAHIPGSRFLDLAALGPSPVADVPALGPPAPATLRHALADLDPATPIVVTDMEGGTATAPFARLALLDAGFADVRLLDGGTPAWTATGHALVGDTPRFVDRPRRRDERSAGGGSAGIFVATAATARAVANPQARVVDARAVPTNAEILPTRYADVVVPADAVLRPGEVLSERHGAMAFRAPGEIARLARERGIAEAPGAVVAACHFGVGAAVVATALEVAGLPRPAVDAAGVLGWARHQARSG